MAVTGYAAGDSRAAPARRPVLPARRSERVQVALTTQAPLLHELSGAVGGPFHVLFPERFDANLDSFARVAADERVPVRVHFAKKANKAATWVRHCADRGAGVDVSSVGELTGALGGGVRGEHLIVSGPAKSAELLRLAVLHGALVTVDAPDELARLTELAATLRPARVLLRARPLAEPGSRFGMSEAELDDAAGHCLRHRDVVGLEGFAVHLGGYAAAPRAAEAVRLAARCAGARGSGLPATVVDLGGGFPVDYLDADDWAGFDDDPAHFHAGRRFGGFYPYHSAQPGAATLRAVLRTPADDGRTVSDVLRDAGLTLLVEPGRALLDQAGCTVFRVQGVAQRDGYDVVTVDGTSLSLSEQWFGSEFLPDPVLLASRREPGADGPREVCVGGASCLESDMLTWRRVPLPHRPRAGDLLVYLNTAGYQMDSNESSFHELPLPPKIVLGPLDSAPRWWFDRA